MIQVRQPPCIRQNNDASYDVNTVSHVICSNQTPEMKKKRSTALAVQRQKDDSLSDKLRARRTAGTRETISRPTRDFGDRYKNK